jgi:hypothetical protein
MGGYKGMNQEFMQALEQIEKEKGISKEVLGISLF